jgi:hypothetical protein
LSEKKADLNKPSLDNLNKQTVSSPEEEHPKIQQQKKQNPKEIQDTDFQSS